MKTIYDVVDRYCSYPKAHPITTIYYRELQEQIDDAYKFGEIDLDEVNKLKARVGTKLGVGSNFSQADIVEKYYSKYYRNSDMDNLLSNVNISDLIKTTETSEKLCAAIYNMCNKQMFKPNNPVISSIFKFLLKKIKLNMAEKNEEYWNYVDVYKSLVPNMVKHGYIDRITFKTEIAIFKVLIKEEISFNDTLGIDELNRPMHTFSSLNIWNYKRELRLNLLMLYVENLVEYKKELKRLSDEYNGSDEKSVATQQVLYESQKALLQTQPNKFNVLIFQSYIGAVYREIENPWIVLFNYTEASLIKIYGVLRNIVNDYAGKKIIYSLADMHLNNVANLRYTLPADELKKITVAAFEADLQVMVENNVMSFFEIKEYVENFKSTYDEYWKEL